MARSAWLGCGDPGRTRQVWVARTAGGEPAEAPLIVGDQRLDHLGIRHRAAEPDTHARLVDPHHGQVLPDSLLHWRLERLALRVLGARDEPKLPRDMAAAQQAYRHRSALDRQVFVLVLSVHKVDAGGLPSSS